MLLATDSLSNETTNVVTTVKVAVEKEPVLDQTNALANQATNC